MFASSRRSRRHPLPALHEVDGRANNAINADERTLGFIPALVRSLPSGRTAFTAAGALLDTATAPSPALLRAQAATAPGFPAARPLELAATSALTGLPPLTGGFKSLAAVALAALFTAGVSGAGSSSGKSPSSLSPSEPAFRPEPF
jgi:hypothetical protein